MIPYKDVKSCMGCCVSTRVPRQRKTRATNHSTSGKVEGDTTSEDDGERQKQHGGEKDVHDDDEDDNENLLDIHNTRGQDANQLVEDEEITVDQYSRLQKESEQQQQKQLEEFPTNEADVVAEILSTDNQSESGKGADKAQESAVVDIESPSPEQEQQQQDNVQEIVQTDTVESEQTRSPDFLDMCCGDPLELEKYLGRKNDTTTKKALSSSTEAAGAANETVIPSLQSSLSKMAIEDESKGVPPLAFQYSGKDEQSDN